MINGVIAGSLLALVSVGFALIHATTRIFHFAHGAVYTISVYIFYSLLSSNLVIAIFGGLAASVLAGSLIDVFVYRPLVKRRASPLIQLLSSIGSYIVLISAIALVFGNEPKVIRSGVSPVHQFGLITVTETQII